MNRRGLLGARVVHMLVLTVLVAVAVVDWIRVAVPMWEFVLGGGVILAWMLGQHYERTIVLEAGLADPEELKAAERESRTWLPWGT